jgi:hypothetical protein
MVNMVDTLREFGCCQFDKDILKLYYILKLEALAADIIE